MSVSKTVLKNRLTLTLKPELNRRNHRQLNNSIVLRKIEELTELNSSLQKTVFFYQSNFNLYPVETGLKLSQLFWGCSVRIIEV